MNEVGDVELNLAPSILGAAVQRHLAARGNPWDVLAILDLAPGSYRLQADRWQGLVLLRDDILRP